MNLYLCKYDLTRHRYMSKSEALTGHYRLVRAKTAVDAETKLRKTIEVNDPYCTSEYVENLEVLETIE